MPQNKNILSKRVTDWEDNQIGLPEDSEIIWGKLELALEADSNKKTSRFAYQYLVAASIITLIVSGVFLYNKFDKKSNQVVSIKKPLRINNDIENSKEALKSTFTATKSLAKNKRALNLNNDVKQSIELTSEKLIAINSEKIKQPIENTAPIIVANTTAETVKNIVTPIENNISSKPNSNFWKQKNNSSKNKFHFPLVHANEISNTPYTSKNALVQFLTDEKPMPNFEVPPPNDVKNKWKITLQPATIPVALTDHQ
jgi:hypothetical protein